MPPAPKQSVTSGKTSAVGPFATYYRGPINLPDFDAAVGVELTNIRSCAVAYYVGIFARIGAFRAADELVSRFLNGFDVGSKDLAARLCQYVEMEPTRLAEDDRDAALARLFEDATLETLLERLADATIAWDLSRSAGGLAVNLKWLPEATARLIVHAAIEDLQVFLDAQGGAGIALAAHMAGEQLVDIFAILSESELALRLAGETDSIFDVIAVLLADDRDAPTALEAQQMARMASSGRKAILETAAIIDGGGTLLTAKAAQLQTLGDAVYQWRAAHGTLDIEVLLEDDSDDSDDDDDLDVIRLRRRAS